MMERDESGGQIDRVHRILQCAVDRVRISLFPEFGANQRAQTVAGDLVSTDAEQDECICIFFSAVDLFCQRQCKLSFVIGICQKILRF